MRVSSVQTISRLDSQSRLKMITLFCDRHVGVPQRYTGLYKFVHNISTNIWNYEKSTDFKLGEVSSLVISCNITNSWLYLPNGSQINFFYCATVQAARIENRSYSSVVTQCSSFSIHCSIAVPQQMVRGIGDKENERVHIFGVEEMNNMADLLLLAQKNFSGMVFAYIRELFNLN